MNAGAGTGGTPARDWQARRRGQHRRVLIAAAATLLVGCVGIATVPPRLPGADATAERRLVRVRSSICSPRHCRVNVDVGAEKIPVESDFRVTSDAKALGEHESAGDVIGAAVFDEVFTLLGGIVSRLRVGLGTSTVALPTDASLRLRCRVAWASERTRQRVEGETETFITMLREGAACEAVRTADSAVTWRFRAGPAPRADSIVRNQDATLPGGQRGGEAGDDGRVHGDECSPPAGESPRQAFPGTGDGGNRPAP